jgi:hypothetical protein
MDDAHRMNLNSSLENPIFSDSISIFRSSNREERRRFLGEETIYSADIDISDMTASILDELTSGNFALEFFIQAIPCYIFFAAFIKRHKQISDLGFPRRTFFGWLLNVKIFLSVFMMLLRILQIMHAFDVANIIRLKLDDATSTID